MICFTTLHKSVTNSGLAGAWMRRLPHNNALPTDERNVRRHFWTALYLKYSGTQHADASSSSLSPVVG